MWMNYIHVLVKKWILQKEKNKEGKSYKVNNNQFEDIIIRPSKPRQKMVFARLDEIK